MTIDLTSEEWDCPQLKLFGRKGRIEEPGAFICVVCVFQPHPIRHAKHYCSSPLPANESLSNTKLNLPQ